MKKYIPLLLASFFMVSLPVYSKDSHHHHHNHKKMGHDKVSEMSVYNLNSHWVNQDNKKTELKDFSGKIQVLAMIYTSCKSACPRIVLDMKILEADLVDKYPGNVNFVLISFDSKRDTPEKLKEFAEEYKFDLKRWTLLHGSDQDILELAAVMGVRYKKINDLDFSHSNIISVLDKNGEIVHRQIGLGANPDSTLAAIDKLLKK